MVEEEARGIREAGGNVTIYKIEGTPETVGAQYEVLTDPSTLEKYDGFLFGIPTRYGNWPAQFKTFWDKTVSYIMREALNIY